MSKLKLIEGQKQTNESNLRYLYGKIKLRNQNLSQKDCVIFAYHLSINGDTMGARRFLKRLNSFYFTHEIYQDLYHALLAWAMKDVVWNEAMMKEHQYFLIVKKCIPVFKDFNFAAKPEFLDFAKQFHLDTTIVL